MVGYVDCYIKMGVSLSLMYLLSPTSMGKALPGGPDR